MKLLSVGLLWPSTFVICLFSQSIFALPSTPPSSNDFSTDLDGSSKNSADSEEVILTLNEQSDDSVDSEEVTLTSDEQSDDSVNTEEVSLSSDGVVTSGGENQEEEDEKSAYEYMSKYGYLVKEKNEGPSSFISLSGPLKKMQEFAGIPVSGKLDDATKRLMKHKRCGLPDIIEPNSSIGKRFSAQARWRRNSLTYRIFGYPTNSYNLQNNNRVETLIETAFRDWSSVANLNFRKTSSYYNDIKIDFLSGDHGDGYQNRFDGPGSTLAHAFFPENGRLHFDDDERWADGYIRGAPNLRQVTTHEIGHILGLGHSSVRNAVMYPYYSYRSSFKLEADDINGAVYLYGRNQVEATTRNPFFPFSSTTRRTTTTTRRSTTTKRTTTTRRPTTTRRSTTRRRFATQGFIPFTTQRVRFTPPTKPRITTIRRRNMNNWWYWFFHYFG